MSTSNQGILSGKIMQRYDEKIEEDMKTLYESLNEKDKRRYAGVEALKLGRGGQVYMEEVLGCDRNTIAKGGMVQNPRKLE
jgi:hypothetical protein